MEIKNKYCTLPQCITLKAEGLVAISKKCWVKYSSSEYKEMTIEELDNLDNSIGIGSKLIIPKYEQWQVADWFRVNNRLYINIFGEGFNGNLEYFYYSITEDGWINYYESIDDGFTYTIYEEAYEAAIEYLIKKVL
jgi:hypothetical protein